MTVKVPEPDGVHASNMPMETWTVADGFRISIRLLLLEIVVGLALRKIALDFLAGGDLHVGLVWYSALLHLVVPLAGLCLLFRHRKRWFGRHLWNWSELRDVRSWLFVMIIAGISLLVTLVIRLVLITYGAEMLQISSWHWGPRLVIWIGSVAVVPLVEEWLFRGVLLWGLTNRFGGRIGLVLTAVLFAAVHDVRTAPVMCLHGLLLGWIALRRRSLTVPIVAHAVINAAVLLL